MNHYRLTGEMSYGCQTLRELICTMTSSFTPVGPRTTGLSGLKEPEIGSVSLGHPFDRS